MVIPENKGDWVLNVCKTKIQTEYREQQNISNGVSRIKHFNVSIFLMDCQSYTFALINAVISDMIYIIVSCHKCKKKFCHKKCWQIFKGGGAETIYN